MDEEDHSFVFNVSNTSDVDNMFKTILVDTGASAHIINDKEKFVRFDENFDSKHHSIELADGSRATNVVKGKGDAQILLHDIHGNESCVVLKNSLYIPSYEQDILSVTSVTENGGSVKFTSNFAKLILNRYILKKL